MYFSSKNGFKILKYIAEGNTFIVNYQLSIVNFYRANGAINRNLPLRNFMTCDTMAADTVLQEETP